VGNGTWKLCLSLSVGKDFRGSKSFLEDKFRAASTRLVFYEVEDLPNDIDAHPPGPDVFKWPAADALRIATASVIAENKADAILEAFHLQPNWLFVLAIGVPNDVGASFVQAEDEKLN
jgi:hypothetical protein